MSASELVTLQYMYHNRQLFRLNCADVLGFDVINFPSVEKRTGTEIYEGTQETFTMIPVNDFR